MKENVYVFKLKGRLQPCRRLVPARGCPPTLYSGVRRTVKLPVYHCGQRRRGASLSEFSYPGSSGSTRGVITVTTRDGLIFKDKPVTAGQGTETTMLRVSF